MIRHPAAPILSLLLSLLLSVAVGGPIARAATETNPVSQEQFRKMVDYLKKMAERDRAMESRIKELESSPKSGGGGGEVDLSKMGNGPVASATTSAGGSHASMGSSGEKTLKVLFDLDLLSRPGVRGQNFTFTNFHSFVFLESLPLPDLQFSFHLSDNPKYYELDWQPSSRIQVRVGKIWIPFDDLSPHNIFGGRVNVSKLVAPDAVNPDTFLPDLWTDYGVGIKLQLIDSRKLSALAHLYVVNGFQSGGTDPTGTSPVYPKFGGDAPPTDNNRDKAIGGRFQATFFNKFSVGASAYSARWNDEAETKPARLTIVGLDTQLRLGVPEFRAGLATMSVSQTDAPGFKRGGLYAEGALKLGKKQDWKALVRVGSVQLDDRAIDTTDQSIVGGTLVWRPGLIEYSLTHARDMNTNIQKLNKTYTALRVIVAL